MNKELKSSLQEYFKGIDTMCAQKWYVKWWGICTYEKYLNTLMDVYSIEREEAEVEEHDHDCYSSPTHILTISLIPTNIEIDDNGEFAISDGYDTCHVYTNNIHGWQLPIVIEDNTIEEVEASMYDEEYYKAREWVSLYVDEVMEDNIHIGVCGYEQYNIK